MKNTKLSKSAIVLLAAIQCILLSACSITFNVGNSDVKESSYESPVRIGIAWRADTDSEFYTNIVAAVKEAGGEPVLLEQVIDNDLEYEDGKVSPKGVSKDEYLDSEYSEIVKKNTYKNSNAEAVVRDVDAVIFTGGEDISPMLLEDPEEWIGIEEEKDFNATRDVSDYLLMAYCIDNDIPTMGFCRGMQMMAVVSGGTMIQNIPTFFEENGLESAMQLPILR